MNTATATSKRIAPGHYVTADGFAIVKVVDYDGIGISGWHLIDAEGEWCNTFPTKGDALAAATRISQEN